ncbi:hypothetical protein A8H38_19385 [Burkholderia thailandensis]|nr:hypothetical protein A8H38_19385 [Burkholderia thailandensis]
MRGHVRAARRTCRHRRAAPSPRFSRAARCDVGRRRTCRRRVRPASFPAIGASRAIVSLFPSRSHQRP